MLKRYTPLFFLTLLVLSTSLLCNYSTPTPTAPAGDGAGVEATLAVVQATQTAMAAAPTTSGPTPTSEASPSPETLPTETLPPTPTQKATSTSEPSPGLGDISGRLSYPSEGIPPLRVIAFSLAEDTYYFIDTDLNQTAYRIRDIPAGDYHVVAYVIDDDSGFAGGYSQAVLCGLGAGCDDHRLVLVRVKAGQETADIDPGDWYAPSGAFPPGPFAAFGPESEGGIGSISGSLSYPSEGIPPLWVVAYNLDTGEYYFTDTDLNQSYYTLDGLPAGRYHVVAYPQDGGPDFAAGYSEAVLCGLGAGCDDHSLVAVLVKADEDTGDIDPGDWYAPANAFPPRPFDSTAGDGAEGGFGYITGALSYPSEGIPPLRIVAFDRDSGSYFYIDTVANQGGYRMDLPEGVYYIVAYVIGDSSGLAGGYTQAVPCGLGAGCQDHTLLEVDVVAGEETPGIDPGDWYAPPGFFFPNPVP